MITSFKLTPPRQPSGVLNWWCRCLTDLVPLSVIFCFPCFILLFTEWLRLTFQVREEPLLSSGNKRVSGNSYSRSWKLDYSLFFLGSTQAPQTLCQGLAAPVGGTAQCPGSRTSLSLLTFCFPLIVHISHLWSWTWLLGFLNIPSPMRNYSHMLSSPPALYFWLWTFNITSLLVLILF